MKYLTFLDYSVLETAGKNIESNLLEKEKEIQVLKQRDSFNSDAISLLSDQLVRLTEEIGNIKKNIAKW